MIGKENLAGVKDMKILLADDHALFREGMHHVLCRLDGDASILDAASFSEAMSIAGNNPDLDLALLDLKMPGSDSAASVKLFYERHPNIRIVVISGTEQREDVLSVINSGAMGFISKASTGKEMIKALRMVLEGETYLPPQLLQMQDVVGEEEKYRDGRSCRTNKHGLTLRQIEVLQYLGQGMTNKEIAEATGLAEGTVKIHVGSLFKNLNVNNRTEAAQVGLRLGLIAGEEIS